MIPFLDKLISEANFSTGVTITARLSKLVAGLDLAKTNELFQAITKALATKANSAQALDKF